MFELANLEAELAAAVANRNFTAQRAKEVPMEEWKYNLEVIVIMYDAFIKDLEERIDAYED